MSGGEAPSPGLAMTAWEAGWLGGAPGLVIAGLPLSPPPGQLLAPPHGPPARLTSPPPSGPSFSLQLIWPVILAVSKLGAVMVPEG